MADRAGLPGHVQQRVDDAGRFVGWVLFLQVAFGIGVFLVLAILYGALGQTSAFIVMLGLIGVNALTFYLLLRFVYGPIIQGEFERAVTPCLIFLILVIILVVVFAVAIGGLVISFTALFSVIGLAVPLIFLGLSVLAAVLLAVAYWNLRRAKDWVTPPAGTALRAP